MTGGDARRIDRDVVFHVLYYKLKNKLFYFIFFADLGRNYKNYKETSLKRGRENLVHLVQNCPKKQKCP